MMDSLWFTFKNRITSGRFFDSVLSTKSDNAVQNKTITNAINGVNVLKFNEQWTEIKSGDELSNLSGAGVYYNPGNSNVSDKPSDTVSNVFIVWQVEAQQSGATLKAQFLLDMITDGQFWMRRYNPISGYYGRWYNVVINV